MTHTQYLLAIIFSFHVSSTSMCFLQVFWKCYEYGDDLIQIFEFIDDQRAKSVRGLVNDATKLDGDNLKDFPFRCDHRRH